MPRQRISSGSPWEDKIGYSRAVKVGDRIWVSGTTGTRPDGTVPTDLIDEVRVALNIIADALTEAGATIDDVVAARVYCTDIDRWEAIGSALHEKFGTAKPALVMVQVARLISPDQHIEIEVEAVVGSA